MFLLGTIKTNDVPQSITDNIKLCNDESIQLVDAIIQVILSIVYTLIYRGDFLKILIYDDIGKEINNVKELLISFTRSNYNDLEIFTSSLPEEISDNF